MIKENFNPVYNKVKQVKDCASFMLGEEVVDARIAIVIGHNGRSFVSSTDWRLTTKSGAHRILPFSMRPQYPNFLECVAGVGYEYKLGQLHVLPDAPEKRLGAVIELAGKRYTFESGKALIIYVQPDSKFIATDCAVEYEERQNERVFRIIENENTLYGVLDSEGRISQARL